jgi:hypothetical protein
MVTMENSACAWCGCREVKKSLTLHILEESSSGKLRELSFDYCSMGCAWAWGMEEERRLGRMPPTVARSHLIHEHGLEPGHSPAGVQTEACKLHFASEVARVKAFVSGLGLVEPE